MRKRNQRLIVIAVALGLLSLAAGLTLFGLRGNVQYFQSPSEIDAKARAGQMVRLGGLVEAGSIARDDAGALIFSVTDGAASKSVRYEGDPPDLFREGQGVVAIGRYQPGAVFEADQILARHDETYMPREAKEALERSGLWKGPQS
ncbi:MAG: cytochrome c maturation protein CcmE [Alphaproteobacteria bacterium]|nr:cytochrome c maturation protein CcmE [Alphaproteobacteria bacterium]